MKKAMSLLLCLLLLLGTVPAAMAAEAEAPDPPETFPAEGPLPEEAELVLSETARPAAAPELPENKENEAPVQEEKPVFSLDWFSEPEEDDASLMAGNATVSVTLSLPEGTSASGSVLVYLYSKAETDDTGRVTRTPVARSVRGSLDGASPLTAVFSGVEAGEYFIGINGSGMESSQLRRESY